MAEAFKFLVVADDTAEFGSALAFAAQRVKVVGGALTILRVVETSNDQTQWVSVSEEMRAEALEAAGKRAERLAAEVWAEFSVQPEIIVREGELRGELKRLIDQDRSIRMLVLGAGAGRDGPGPLVSTVLKGGQWGARAIPVVVVPGTLSKDEARELASPA
jgi:nucleotide-binding universal stress UspA family protein